MGEDSIKPGAVIGVIPLFPDKAASVPVVKHAVHVVKNVASPWHGPANICYWKAHSCQLCPVKLDFSSLSYLPQSPIAILSEQDTHNQLLLLTLSIHKNEAYTIYQDQDGPCNRTQWEKNMKYMSNLFLYWSMVMNIELLECRFVPSLREGDFTLYVQVIDEVCDYAFMFI